MQRRSVSTPDIDGRLDIDITSLNPDMVVADGIHNLPRTNLVRDADARGCTAVDGLSMLVNHGVITIKYWTDVDVDPSVMRKTVGRLLYPTEEAG